MVFDGTHYGARELATQVDRLVRLGYPALADRTPEEFRATLAGLAPVADGLDEPFVVVVSRELVTPERTVPLLRLDGSGRPGTVDRHHDDLAAYRPIAGLDVPEGPGYLLLGAERGEEFRGVPPREALPAIQARGRTPLTIEEGVALVAHRPDLLERNACFSLAGSRRGDKRVPALWISSGAPKLGWCWDGNPHDWLGVASARARVA